MNLDLDDDRILGSLLEGKWRLVRRIGRGGMGQVFQVVHARMGIVKCVKILRPGADEVMVKRFEREVRLAQQIRHPNVIRIDDFGVDTDMDPQGVPFYIMEFVEGRSLRDLVALCELPVERAANLVRQAA
ncbi:MAG: protein kinase, partial [Planctomycetes bacterium]|nr:protein kinase [Planctomycetota bacterium]